MWICSEEEVCEGLETTSKSTTSERAIPSWIGSGEEGEPSWRWEILRGIPHLSNVTYLPSGEGNTGLHLRLRVLRLSLTELFTCVVYFLDSLRA